MNDSRFTVSASLSILPKILATMESLKLFIEQLIAAANEAIIPYFGNPDLEVELKKDSTPVTLADRGAESAMRQLIEAKYPEHGIIGEEYGNKNTDAEFVWVLDPIDGTKSFTAGTPQFGTLVALTQNGKPVLGAINNPVTKQLLIGDGNITTLNRRPIKIRDITDLSQATLLTTDLDAPEKAGRNPGWNRLVAASRKLYTWGDCHGYSLICTGGAHIMCDPVLEVWDLMALIPVIRGAGGIITTWDGKPAEEGGSVVASVPSIYDKAMELLHG